MNKWIVALAMTAGARFVKIKTLGSVDGKYASIAELDLYGN